MYGEIDLELYTVSIIRLNTAFEKLNSSENIEDIKELLKQSYSDLQELYEDIVKDLNKNEINFNEYYLFFQNGKEIFPQYIEVLQSIDNEELTEIVNLLLNVFSNLNKIADGFKRSDFNEMEFK